MVDAVLRGGGELVSLYAKEPDLAAASEALPAGEAGRRSENEILEDCVDSARAERGDPG